MQPINQLKAYALNAYLKSVIQDMRVILEKNGTTSGPDKGPDPDHTIDTLIYQINNSNLSLKVTASKVDDNKIKLTANAPSVESNNIIYERGGDADEPAFGTGDVQLGSLVKGKDAMINAISDLFVDKLSGNEANVRNMSANEIKATRIKFKPNNVEIFTRHEVGDYIMPGLFAKLPNGKTIGIYYNDDTHQVELYND